MKVNKKYVSPDLDWIVKNKEEVQKVRVPKKNDDIQSVATTRTNRYM